MRAVLLCSVALALAGCGDDVCAGVDGACVALAVRGSAEIDGLDITLSGAASGRRVAPERASVATLPVHVALQLPDAQAGELAIRVVAVRLGAIVGGGETSIRISPGAHASAALDLGDVEIDGGLTSANDLSCPAATTRCGGACCKATERCGESGCTACPGNANACGDVCCPTGQVCNADGACALPFTTAQLYVYLCPDFGNGCTTSAFHAGGMCSALQAPQAGHCYATGITVEAGKSYSISSCQSCPGNCSSPSSFTTPSAGFATQSFYSGIYFYCQTPCQPPTTCP